MVNKQYSVSGGGSHNNNGNDLSSTISKKLFNIKRNITKRNSASLGNISIISLHPEPDPLFVNSVSGSYYQKYSVDGGGGGGCYGDTDSGSSIYSAGGVAALNMKKKSEYMFAEEKLDNSGVVGPRFSACAVANPVRNVKELTINDIGRFQYILEMDNELNSHNQKLCNLSQSSTSFTYSGNSILNVWKSAFLPPHTTSSHSLSRRKRIVEFMKNWYQTFKWPLLLILSCILLGLVTFYTFRGYLNEDNDLEWEDPDKPWPPQTETLLKLVPNSENNFWTIFNKPPFDKNITDSKRQSLKEISFTSGHQNSFGIPLEEDERILKMFAIDDNTEEEKITHTKSVIKLNVSPTLPSLTPTEESSNSYNVTTSVNGNCRSTSLDICRGILQYDLTSSRRKAELSLMEQEHFRYLANSKCSSRSSEFVCAVLEPECRPKQMGVLQPCKRICKSILEQCSSVIASSEVLTMIFDCDRYPDSSDRNVCEDPTRRSNCLSNEFKCLDSSCIPKQWECDNIKDCSLGEDEENCMFCDHDEFRCHTNDKCIPEKYRCDNYNDCTDGSDEEDCFDYNENLEDDYPNLRVYSFASIQSPDGDTYVTIKGNDDDIETTQKTYAVEENDTRVDSDKVESSQASGKVTVEVPKSLGRSSIFMYGNLSFLYFFVLFKISSKFSRQ
ncbi:hypothetical protein ACFFRR_009102 [Megaselia abdita]